MDSDEIISLVFEYEHAADGDGDSQFCGRSSPDPSFLAMQAAIQLVVNERDEALAECARMREQYSDQLEEARMEYVKHRAECDARGKKLSEQYRMAMASWLTESHECRRLQQQLDRLRR